MMRLSGLKNWRQGFLMLLALGLAILFWWLARGANDTYALVGVQIIDGTGRPPIEAETLVIQGDRVVDMGPEGQVDIPPEARVMDLSGYWVTPGLVDAHVHFFQSGSLYTRPDVIDLQDQRSYFDELRWLQERLPQALNAYLCSGVTSVMDFGGPFWTLQLREQTRQGQVGPRIGGTGPLLATWLPADLDELEEPPMIELQNPEQAQTAVEQVLEHDPDAIKVWLIPRPDLEQHLNNLDAVVQTAHKAGKRVAVHAMELDAAKHAVIAGADILVHSLARDPVDDELLELIQLKDILYVTTLSVHHGYNSVLSGEVELLEVERHCGDPDVIETWSELPEQMQRPFHQAPERLAAENAKKVYQAGGRIAVGTDAGNIGTLHGPAIHREMRMLEKLGIPPMDILLAATRHAAESIKGEPEFGSLFPGQKADLLVLRKNPLQTVKNLEEIEFVFQNGVLHQPETLVTD